MFFLSKTIVFEVSTKPLLEVFCALFGRPGPPFRCPRAARRLPRGARRLPRGAQSPPQTPQELSLDVHSDVFSMFFRELEPDEVKGTVLESLWLHLG